MNAQDVFTIVLYHSGQTRNRVPPQGPPSYPLGVSDFMKFVRAAENAGQGPGTSELMKITSQEEDISRLAF